MGHERELFTTEEQTRLEALRIKVQSGRVNEETLDSKRLKFAGFLHIKKLVSEERNGETLLTINDVIEKHGVAGQFEILIDNLPSDQRKRFEFARWLYEHDRIGDGTPDTTTTICLTNLRALEEGC